MSNVRALHQNVHSWGSEKFHQHISIRQLICRLSRIHSSRHFILIRSERERRNKGKLIDATNSSIYSLYSGCGKLMKITADTTLKAN